MTNANVLQERESSFRFERLEKNYSMQYADCILNKETEGEADITALLYKMNGSGNTFQRFNIYSFRRNVRFIEDNATNRKALQKVNSELEKLIKAKGKDLTYGDLKPLIDQIDSLEFVNPFQPVEGKEDLVSVPDGIEVLSVMPKVNVGLFDTPSNKSKLRYTTRSYKANNYIRKDSGEFATSEEGESLSFLARDLASNEQYDDIIDLYDAAIVDETAAKDPRNLVFNNAICVVTQ